jgi:hypothetical protein
MFSSWFSNKEELKSGKELESDNESVEEDFLNCMMYEDDNVKFYSSDARDF